MFVFGAELLFIFLRLHHFIEVLLILLGWTDLST